MTDDQANTARRWSLTMSLVICLRGSTLSSDTNSEILLRSRASILFHIAVPSVSHHLIAGTKS
jgi:hypothetical protein